MQTFDELLKHSTTIHGHTCAGQVIGVRLSMIALREIGIDDPKGADRKKLYVMVEIDRCATDAIQCVTGCTLGKRSLKWFDYGVMAATFVNLDTGKAVRVTAREESRELAKKYIPETEGKYKQQLEAYMIMPEEELFKIEYVEVNIPKADMPGRPLKRVECESCGDWVQDCREVEQDGKTMCKQCATSRYYKVVT